MNIHRLLSGTLALVLIAGLVTSQAFAQSTTGNEEDLLNQNIATPLQVEEVDCDVDSGDIVAINTSNGLSPNGFSMLITDLEAEGFVVRTVNLSNGIPECVVKLIIAGTNNSQCVPGGFVQADIDIITAFVNNGGALALFNELSFCSATNPIAVAFGETPNADSFSETYTANTNWDPTSPATLFDGVTDWRYVAGETYQSSPDAVVTRDSPFPGDQPVMIAKEFGQGCVLMNGDGDWIQNIAYGLLDNSVLGVNIFQFLNECIAPEVVGGELLPIDNTALFLAGIQSSTIWMLPALAGAAGAGAYYIRTRMNKDN